MVNNFSARLKQILKAAKAGQLYYYLRSLFFMHKEAVPVEKDLATLRPVQVELERAGVEIIQLAMTPEAAVQNSETRQSLTYPDKERRKTVMKYLRKGYRGVALVDGNDVIGDIWYASAATQRRGAVHPDLKWLGIKCGDNAAYAFDMYLPPARRGKNMANMLQNGALHEIKKNGYSRALGYFWADNLPALWVHRMLKWNELKRVKVTRLLCFYHSHVCEESKAKKDPAGCVSGATRRTLECENFKR